MHRGFPDGTAQQESGSINIEMMHTYARHFTADGAKPTTTMRPAFQAHRDNL